MNAVSIEMSSVTSSDRIESRSRAGSVSSAQSDTSTRTSDDQGCQSGTDRERELKKTYGKPGFVFCDPVTLPHGEEPDASVDIVCVAAIGAHPINTWRAKPKYAEMKRLLADKASTAPDNVQRALLMSGILSTVFTKTFVPLVEHDFEPPWVLHSIKEKIRGARILLYNHGEPQEDDTIDALGARMLLRLLARRPLSARARPIVFICHSTGGLVVKQSLVIAQQNERFASIWNACYGISFFATPHQGSSYLSSPDFTQSVSKAMRLIWPLPGTVQQQLKVQSHFLRDLSSNFMSVASELRIWTFYETVDTDLTDPKSMATNSISFLAPITSIRSAILNLHHEIDRALASNHVDCPSFGGSENLHAKASFLDKLSAACEHASTLAQMLHKDLNLEEIIEVEVHGFYEHRASGVETDGSQYMQPIRLYSTRNPLSTFLKKGPRRCLDDRLQEKDTPATNHKMMNRSTSRRTSFLHDTTSARPVDPKSKHESPGVSTAQPKENHKRMQSRQGVPSTNDQTLGLGISQSRPVLFENITFGPITGRHSSPDLSRRSAENLPPKLSITTDTSSSRRLDGRPTVTADTAEAIPVNVIPPSPTSDTSEEIRDSQALHTNSTLDPNLEGEVKVHSLVSADHPTTYQPTTETRSSRSRTTNAKHRTSSTGRSLSPAPTSADLSRSGLSERRWSSPQDGRGYPTAALLLRPDPSTQKLSWIHLAFNNPTWVKRMFERIAADNKVCDCEIFLDTHNWTKRHLWGRHTEHHACFVKPGCTLLNPATKVKSPALTAVSPNVQLSFFLPYLHWDTYKRMVRRRDLVKERIAQGRSRPLPPKVARSDLEHQVSWTYLSHDPPFNTRRTLDQFRYPYLLDTRARDDDQMLYKLTKVKHRYDDKASAAIDTVTDSGVEDSPEDEPSTLADEDEKEYEHLRDGKVLMVDQVWMWAMDSPDNSTLVTFFPQRETIRIEGKLYQQADLRNSIYNEVNADLSRRCESALDLAGLVALHAVTLLFERSSHHDLEVFRIFEESLSAMAEKMTRSYKFFRAKGFRATEDDGEDSEEEPHSLKERHKKEGRQFQAQIRDNVSAVLELRDIADELMTLQKLFKEQEEAITSMRDIFVSKKRADTNGHSFLAEALSRLEDYGQRVNQMIESADRTRKEFEKLLDLVQRQANVDEARLSRWQADLQSSQSRAVMIFTVFTIIFLPLTFFTGFFGMNTSEWAGMDSMVSIFTIAAAAIPLSVFIIASALALALSIRIRRWTIFLIRFLVNPFEEVSIEGTRQSTSPDAKRSRKARARTIRLRRPKEAPRKNDYDEGDFWEDQREAPREQRYEIPAQNRLPKPPVPKKPKRKTTSSFGSLFWWMRGKGNGRQDSNA